MPVETRVDIIGLDKLEAGLKGMRRTLQRKTLRKPLFYGMEFMRKTIAAKAPVLNTKKRGGAWMLKYGARKKGLVRSRIKTIWSKLQVSRGNAGVWVTAYQPGASAKVKREEGAYINYASRKRREAQKALIRAGGSRRAFYRSRRGKGAVPLKTFMGAGRNYFPNDPFYFKFLEQGTKFIPKARYQWIGRVASGAQGNATMAAFTTAAIEAIEKLKTSDIK